jgi:uncharacterized protein YgiM (DUF1202 family)
MTHRTILLTICTLAAIFAMSFMLAACSSSKPEPPAAGPPAGKGAAAEQPAPVSAPPAATEAPPADEREAAQRMVSARSALGDQVEIRRSWVQVRNNPSPDAAAIALAFGNDTYPVLEQRGDWVRVKLDGNRDGWIPVAATQDP